MKYCRRPVLLRDGSLATAGRSVALALFALAWLNFSLQAQQRSVGRQSAAPPPGSNAPQVAGPGSGEGVLTDTNKDYLIAPGDVVEVWVEDAPELSRHYRVNAAGEFPMNVVGRIAAREKTTEELARFIALRLRAEEYLNKPNVVVTVRQYNSQTFIIQGAVNKPGLYQLEGRPTLLTLIGLAGGLTDAHGSTAFILRSKPRQTETVDSVETPPLVETTAAKQATGNPAIAQAQAPERLAEATTPATRNNADETAAQPESTAEAGEYEFIRVNLSALYKGHFAHNRVLEPRDIVNIPRADVFFVAGEVNAPGSYPLKEGTTLRQAISLAQGLTFKAKAAHGVIFREDADSGKRQEVKIDINAVMNGKKEDLLITANDVIIVPNSRTKSVSSALLTALGVNSARLPIRY